MSELLKEERKMETQCIQCTKWLEINKRLRLGKILRNEKNSSCLVPKPKRIVSAKEWCVKHAHLINGFTKVKDDKIAVFRNVPEDFFKLPPLLKKRGKKKGVK